MCELSVHYNHFFLQIYLLNSYHQIYFKHLKNPKTKIYTKTGGKGMEQIKELLEKREKQLLQLKKEKEKSLSKAPEGSLRVCCRGKKTQFYRRNDPKDFNGVYIREKDRELAQKLAQKDYDKKICYAAEQELSAIKKYFSNYPAKNIEEIYESLHRERQQLISPIIESDEEYVRKWESVEYQGKAFAEDAPEFFTAKNERVRSKSEWIIADLLNREGIPYRYEYPIYLNGMGKIHPDFTVLNVRTRQTLYWEHMGMMDDPDYVENALHKIAAYEQNEIFLGQGLILTYETRKCPLNQKQVMLMIQNYLR